MVFGIGVDKELKNVQDESTKFGEETAAGIEKEGVAPKEEGGEETKAEVGDTEAPATDVTPPEVSETQQQAKDVQAGADNAEPLQMAGGGHVPGSGSGDTVPAMLTPGEFVMSKGAVSKWGASTLASMNAAGGGTNRPSIMNQYRGGGSVLQSTTNNFNLKGYRGGGYINKPMVVKGYAGGGSVSGGDTISIKLSTSQRVPADVPPPPGAAVKVVQADGAARDAKKKAIKSPGSEVPDFSADTMVSPYKIKTLGITV